MTDTLDILSEIESDLGIEAAMLLSRVYGGQAVSIPNTVKGCKIEGLLGYELADWLVERFGGTMMDIPIGHKYRKTRVKDGVKANPEMSANALARKFGVTRSRINQIRKQLRMEKEGKMACA